MVEFWRDPAMDKMIEDIVDIFSLEGVELVRLSGMIKRARSISGKNDMNEMALNNVIRKLNENNVISFTHIIKCPHCGEISYILKEDKELKPKLCDTCSTLYHLSNGSTLEIVKGEL